MVTERATPETEEQVTPGAEAAPPEESGDELLIPQEAEEGESAEQGTGAEEEGETESAKGEASAETEDTAETEAPKPLTREEHEAEIRKVQSGFDRRMSELEKSNKEALTAAEQRAQQAEQQLSQSQLEVQVAQWQRQKAQEYVNAGRDDETAQLLAATEARYARSVYETEVARRRAEAELEKARTESTSLSTRQAAVELATEHGVSDDDMPLLMTAKSPQEMESLAKRLGSLSKEAQELARLREAEVPAGGDANKVDSGGGDAGGRTDDQILNDPDAPLEDIERILEKRGQHPFR